MPTSKVSQCPTAYRSNYRSYSIDSANSSQHASKLMSRIFIGSNRTGYHNSSRSGNSLHKTPQHKL